jgi:predicted ATPase/DNA-binding SARP family transcriptional activator
MEAPQPRDVLADLLWQDRTQRRAMANLRVVLSSLRERLGPFLQIDRELISLNGNSNIWIDVVEFRENLRSNKRQDAVELYKGDFLEGFNIRGAREFEYWVIVQREQTRESVIAALQDLVNLHLAYAQYEEGLPFARRLLEMNPLMESAHRNLMRMLALSGQRDQAMSQFGICVNILAEELDIEPSIETKTLHQQIVAGSFSLDFPEVDFKYDLPEKLTRFIGRENELDEIGVLLDDPSCKLLTIVGPGGAGKSRVAIEFAKSRYGSYPDGVFYISLAGLESVESIAPSLAEAMQLKMGESADPKYWIRTFLRKKRALLLFDNFEHLLGGTDIVLEILGAARDVKVLATSRVALNIQGETVYRLFGMLIPSADITKDLMSFGSVELFVNSAMRSAPNLDLDEIELEYAAEICILVDGLPLGIELAAAWAGILTPAEIAQEVRRGIDLLETDMATLPERQRSLRVVFDHSWDLIADREKEVLGGLSIFRGGFDREAADVIVGASLRELMGLMNKSLIYPEVEGRYGVHELLRQYAAEKFHGEPKEAKKLQDLHCEYFLNFVHQQDVELKSEQQPSAVKKIKADYPNIQSAWNWAVEIGSIVQIDLGIDGLCRFYKWRRRAREGGAACRIAAEILSTKLTSGGSDSFKRECRRVLSKTLTWQSVFLDDYEARKLQQQALGILEVDGFDSSWEYAFLLQQMGNSAIDYNRKVAKKFYEQSMALYDELGDSWETANVLTALGWVANHTGDYDEAVNHGERGLTLHRSIGEPRGIADALWLLGTASIMRLEINRAERLFSESLDLREQIGERITDIAPGPLDLGMTLTWIGRMLEAREVREETLAMYQEKGLDEKIPLAYIRLAYSNGHLGENEKAWTNAKTGLALARKIGDQRAVGHAQFVLAVIEQIRNNTDDAYALLQECIPMFRSVEGAGELGWGLTVLAYSEYKRGDLSAAQQCIVEALQIGGGLLAAISSWITLTIVAGILAEEGDYEQAIELYAFAAQFPMVAKSNWTDEIAGNYIGEIAETLPSNVVADAKARGRARNLDDTISEILAELEEEMKN